MGVMIPYGQKYFWQYEKLSQNWINPIIDFKMFYILQYKYDTDQCNIQYQNLVYTFTFLISVGS